MILLEVSNGKKAIHGEFKREVVRQARQAGSSTAKVAHDLQIHANLLHRWVRKRARSVRIFSRCVRTAVQAESGVAG